MQQKKLFKSRTDKVLDGVCGGIAQYFDLDPVVVRIIWVIVAMMTMPFGIIAYIVAMVLIPKEPSSKASIIDAAESEQAAAERNEQTKSPTDHINNSETEEATNEQASSSEFNTDEHQVDQNWDKQSEKGSSRSILYFAYILIGIGAYFILERFIDFNLKGWLSALQGYIWPLILIGIGLFLLARRKK